MMENQITLHDFQERFPDEESCALFLVERRWPNGFVCPKCGSGDAVMLTSRFYTYACKACGGHTSVTAGTIMQKTKLPLRVWFSAAHWMASNLNDTSALELQRQLGLGSYNSALRLAHKLRLSIFEQKRDLLDGEVEISHTEFKFRSGDAVASSLKVNKFIVIGAFEKAIRGTETVYRVRLAVIPSNVAAHVHEFIRANVKTGNKLVSDDYASIQGLNDYLIDPRIVGNKAADIELRWIPYVFIHLKNWGSDRLPGFRPRHMDDYLNEFAFFYNRAYYPHASFETVLGLEAGHQPKSYWDIIGRENPRKGTRMPRQNVRRRKTVEGMRCDGTGSRSRHHKPKDAE